MPTSPVRERIAVREGQPSDVPAVFALIQALAEYERAPQEVTNTPERMLREGFGENPVYRFFVADLDGEVVGMAIYFYSYSTWKGKSLYLEDFYVKEELRRHGVGKLLFDRVVQTAREEDCQRLHWQVLDWNQPAIDFYKKIGAELDPEWINGKLRRAQIEAWGASK